jgi:ABC-type transporter Mla subunit MlaD
VRRLAAIALALCAVAAAAIAVGAGGKGARGYRVDAIFDNADFLVKGQDVKIAGAVVGAVSGVHVTPDHRARVEMQIEDGFAPFRSDASCTIRPQSLIGEKFVDCFPGSPKGKALDRSAGTPTVPLARNHAPVDLDLVFATLRLPYRQRLALLVNELGTGLAGRPRDLNAAIRRANPALQQANDMLAIIDRDRHTLGQLIDGSDRVIGELSRNRGQVAGFLVHADTVAQAVASRRGDLALAIHRLPPLLDQLQPSATELAGLVTDARPVVRDLRTAAVPVQQLLGDLDPLTQAARPTLAALNELSVTGRSALQATAPVARKLLPVARLLPEVSTLARQLNESLKTSGAVEGLQGFVYFASAATARFDRFSHILPSYQIAGTCQVWATTPTAGCNAHFAGGPLGGAAGAKRARSSPAASAAAEKSALDYLLKP